MPDGFSSLDIKLNDYQDAHDIVEKIELMLDNHTMP